MLPRPSLHKTQRITPTGISYDELADDPNLVSRRDLLITTAAKKLAEARMIDLYEPTGALSVTDLGRIAAKYYIRHSSVEIFNQRFKSVMSEADVLKMLSWSTEVSHCASRESPHLTLSFYST